jgi:hypothetical protein
MQQEVNSKRKKRARTIQLAHKGLVIVLRENGALTAMSTKVSMG